MVVPRGFRKMADGSVEPSVFFVKNLRVIFPLAGYA